MSWNIEGKHVIGNYMGARVRGVVQESRVKYGGKVQHTVVLDEPIALRWRTEPVERVLLDDEEIEFISGSSLRDVIDHLVDQGVAPNEVAEYLSIPVEWVYEAMDDRTLALALDANDDAVAAAQELNDSMDGDFDSAMASAGFGTDEDYNWGA